MNVRPHSFAPAPANRREARAWVREHWRTFMLNADTPDLGGLPEDAAELIADVFCEESCRLSDRLAPRKARP